VCFCVHLTALKYRDLQVLAKEYDLKDNMKFSEIVAQLLQKVYTHVTSTPHMCLDGNAQGGRYREATGATLIKWWHLELLGYTVVSLLGEL